MKPIGEKTLAQGSQENLRFNKRCLEQRYKDDLAKGKGKREREQQDAGGMAILSAKQR